MSILDKYTSIFLDSTSLALLHTEEYKQFIPLIIAKFEAYTTRLAIIEFLSILNYYKIRYSDELVDTLCKIYRIIDIDKDAIRRASLLLSDLMHHGLWIDTVDVIHAAISLEKKLIIITMDDTRYEPFKKYGLITSSTNTLVYTVKKYINED